MTVWAARPGLVLDDRGNLWECLGPVDRAIDDLAVSPLRRGRAIDLREAWASGFEPRDEAEAAYRREVLEGGRFGPCRR